MSYRQYLDSIECSVCFADRTSKRLLLGRDKRLSIVSNIRKNRITQNVIFMNPCGKHPVCKECVNITLLNRESPPINRTTPLVKCISIYRDSCLSENGNPYYYTNSDLNKLVDKESYVYLSDLMDRYKIPGYRIFKCEGNAGKCNADLLVSEEDILTVPKGRLFMVCTQSQTCQRKFVRICFYCKKIISRYSDRCINCSSLIDYNNPDAPNRFIITNTKYMFFKNSEFMNDEVLEYTFNFLKEKLNADKFFVTCVRCGIKIQKTTKCNTIVHCDIEHCYVCGKVGELNDKLIDHWSEQGISGCPRWNNSPFWNLKGLNYSCIENECFDDNSECTVAEHQEGITNMTNYIKKAHLYKFIVSLPLDIRVHVFSRIVNDPDLSKWISYSCPETTDLDYYGA